MTAGGHRIPIPTRPKNFGLRNHSLISTTFWISLNLSFSTSHQRHLISYLATSTAMCRFETIVCPRCKVKQFRAVPRSDEISQVGARAPQPTIWVCLEYRDIGETCVYKPGESVSVVAKDVEQLCTACRLLDCWWRAQLGEWGVQVYGPEKQSGGEWRFPALN